MRKLVVIYLLLDALVVAILGTLNFHGEHGWDFLLVNGVRLGVMAAIVVLWRAGAGSRWLQRVLFGKRPEEQTLGGLAGEGSKETTE